MTWSRWCPASTWALRADPPEGDAGEQAWYYPTPDANHLVCKARNDLHAVHWMLYSLRAHKVEVISGVGPYENSGEVGMVQMTDFMPLGASCISTMRRVVRDPRLSIASDGPR